MDTQTMWQIFTVYLSKTAWTFKLMCGKHVYFEQLFLITWFQSRVEFLLYTSESYIYVYLLIPYVIIHWYASGSHVVLSTIPTFPGKWFSCIGNAFGSTRHCQHCTLGVSRTLPYCAVLPNFSRCLGYLVRSLDRPSYRSDISSQLQQRYFTEKGMTGVSGMVGVHWTV